MNDLDCRHKHSGRWRCADFDHGRRGIVRLQFHVSLDGQTFDLGLGFAECLATVEFSRGFMVFEN
ncbi:MAG: hypothetical protein ACREEM_20490 [Blastocatellia bacterium]